ncbi:hypothetical protein HYH03_001727 [Edaphochlamys debaryana]|uniref:Choice-of-anchor I domain-containing protein n=1 Tax=Edaphochlamys debaryana TaxID=47281 RepID=A0A835YC04_9CHLO|nr:hypothetical protein HYH03_001727 [Edaphochlamys debaryana]|eukprot:KAG2500145.1 hypothetical protein HYH03_001727 [Edaphochlamys debaryana]
MSAVLAILVALAGAQLAAAGEFAGCIPQLGLSVQRLASFKTGNWTGVASVEVLDYDPFGKLSAVVEAQKSATSPLALLIVNLADPSAPAIHRRIPVSDSAGEGDVVGTPNSVSVYNGYAALSLDGVPATADGWIRIYHMASGAKVGEVRVPGCAMPDSVAWTKDGRRLIIACEGEPSTQGDASTGSDPTIDPNPSGAIGIVYVTWASYTPVGADCPTVNLSLSTKVLSFQKYIDKLSATAYKALLSAGLRIDPRLTKATAARDIEPEYVALHSDGRDLAYVTLQENNAIAVINIAPGAERIRSIWPLGLKDWSVTPVDPSDRDGTLLRNLTSVVSWYQPDTIVHTTINRIPYLVIANEGDSKEEALRVSDLKDRLDPAVFSAAQVADVSRLNVDPLHGISGGYNTSKPWNAQGPYTRLYAYGGRSWAILNALTGAMVYESRSELESLVAAHPEASACFNCDRNANVPDTRSDNSGPEPEALAVFELGGRTYASVGLERQSGFVLYDISKPAKPITGAYVYNRDFDPALGSNTTVLGDLAPECIRFVSASASASGKPYLLVGNEVSATVATWELGTCPPAARRRL